MSLVRKIYKFLLKTLANKVFYNKFKYLLSYMYNLNIFIFKK